MSTEMSKGLTDSLQPLFEEAEEKGLWFYGAYHGLWLSPAGLREEHRKGRLRWGAVNWKLRDPKERLEELRRDAAKATKEADDFEKTLGATGKEVPA